MTVKEIISKMSCEQKIRLCTGKNNWQTEPLPELGVPSLVMSDGTNGVRFQKDSTEEKKVVNIYDAMINFSFDSESALNNTWEATCFPSGAALACSWNTALAGEVGRAVARECKRIGIGLLLGPGMNIRRHPLNARSFEYYSEDPVLSGEMAAEMVRGIQSEGVGATIKHFACNNSDTRRTRLNCLVEDRALREIYLAGFERVVKKAKPAAVMGSYPAVNGVQACQNKWLLTGVLRDEWGFEGITLSDWGGVKDSVAAVKAGLDLQMPGSRHYIELLTRALDEGTVSEAELDLHCERLLRLIFQYSRDGKEKPEVDWKAHHVLAQRAAAECGVLLRNEDNILPLDSGKLKTVAVLGGIARTPLYQGTGCAVVHAKQVDIPLEELQKGAPGITWVYAEGYRSDYTTTEALLEEAVKTAKSADLALVLVGSRLPRESDLYDRPDMDLEEGHRKLIEAVCAAQPNTVVVVCNGDAVAMPWAERTKAVLDMWYAGEGSGRAMADLLLGKVNPGGKLPVSIPAKLSDTPAYLDFPHEQDIDRYREGIFAGYRYYDARGIEPLYPFGYGLSYTRFSYDSITVKQLSASAPDSSAEDRDEYEVTVRLTNRGARAGQETVQLYIAPPAGKVFRPPRELKGFSKLTLAPGESAAAVFVLTRRDFAYYDDASGKWRVDEGSCQIMAGGSSRELPLTTAAPLYGDRPEREPLRADSHYTDLFRYPEAGKAYFDFLIEKGLLLPGQGGSKIEGELKKTFWGFSQHLEMLAGDTLTHAMVDELLDRMNRAIT